MPKSLAACLPLTLVQAGILLALGRPRPCPVSRAAFGWIEKGMTRPEVHAVLAVPPGDYRTIRHDFNYAHLHCWQCERFEAWETDEGLLSVSYSWYDGKVRRAKFERRRRGCPARPD
jgi:hypothetical protein